MENQDMLTIARHSLSHILAKAVTELYDDVKLAIGPAIDNGFYYDFDLPRSITADDFDAITAKMQEILKRGEDFVCREVSVDEAKAIFKDQPYKLELIEGLTDEKITLYYTGEDFVDLCRGPHVGNARELRSYAFKIVSSTGAYWRGDSTRPMLQRIYVYAFANKQELKEYVSKVEEARKRDHNKLGRELEYFTTVDYIGQGLPILLPKGAKVIQTLQRFVEDEEARRGYTLTMTPLMAKRELYRISGHWDHYLDGMFVLGDPQDETKECFALRPMTCPFQYQVYLNRPRSYRDLPLRYGETSTLFRNEDSGEMHGLIRVRQFTISEGHLVLRPDQLEEEFRGCLDLAMYMLDALGLREDCTFRFSQWDPNRTDKYEGTPEQWNEAQRIMGEILDHIGLDYEIGIDEAAFYGPKLDIQCKNVFGKEDTIITIQIDMLLAEKFGMEYTDRDGKKVRPYIIHRTSLGCYQRTLALLIEKYAGALPFWISATQVGVVPVRVEHNEYAKKVVDALTAAGLRVDVDYEDEMMGAKVKKYRQDKVPYTVIVGDKEAAEGTVSLKIRGGAGANDVPLDTFVEACREMVKTTSLTLKTEF